PGRRWGSRGLQSGGQSTETGRQRIRTPVNAATTVLILGVGRGIRLRPCPVELGTVGRQRAPIGA
ncbi:hypothetical protein, partial [Mycobacterium sp. PSTR-4-N]|uniref:hypothetical protein n=1 Tax=Mycobacterium sp. PSTR-4-N TaxID=2917745 RepID=UPI001F15181E